ncbi:MAG: class I SAM-dependent methyltransferase [Deltaproteobacteria bacterium]|nr:class I SAM-dependent methyltransferase [Deltaproteobacteria bacterium]
MALGLALTPAFAACGGAQPAPAAPAAAPAAAAPAADPAADPIAAAVAHPDRWGEDRARDADRKPAEVLRFFGLASGQKVAEMMAGRGYYAELLSRVVGPQGRVYVQNNAFVLQKFAAAPLAERLGRGGFGNVVRLDNELEAPGLPTGELDAVLMILFYHDTFWMQADRPKMLAAIFASLRPGGVFGVVDHRAAKGHAADDVKTLHRIEEDVVVREITAAGFVLDGRSDVLAHSADDGSKSVFDPAIRGRTDRFVLRFRKPARP